MMETRVEGVEFWAVNTDELRARFQGVIFIYCVERWIIESLENRIEKKNNINHISWRNEL